jgi:Bacterial Ig-like domain (group 3)/Bacterial Ig-like domain (group 1)/Putative Ig domain/Invasin, domain 3/Domain of unknown function (DUF4214)
MTGITRRQAIGRRLRTVAASTGVALTVGSLSAGLGVQVTPVHAGAAPTYDVTTTTDEHLTTATSTSCVSASGCSLRAAIEAANNAGVATINVPPGTYALSLGELKVGTYPTSPSVSSYNVTIQGTGTATNTIIQQTDGVNRVLNLDPNLKGNVTVSISKVTVTGGHDGTDHFGGAGIISGHPSPADSTTLSNCVVTGNHTTTSRTNSPGGGIQNIGGNLTISDCTVSNNSSNSSAGGGLDFETLTQSPGNLTMTGSTVSGNSMTNTSTSERGGAGARVQAMAGSTVTLSGDTFTGNTASSTSTGPVPGGGLWLQASANVTSSTFTGNQANGPTSPLSGGGAIMVDTSSSSTTVSPTIAFDRIVGNSATNGAGGIHNYSSQATTTATNDWWGCNAGPGSTGCDTAVNSGSGSGTLSVSPRLTLSVTPASSHVATGGSAAVTFSLSRNSAGQDTSSLGHVPDGTPVTFSASLGSMQPATTSTLGGAATTQYTAGSSPGTETAVVTVDNDTATATMTIGQAPVITSITGTGFAEGTFGSFSVTATGTPTPTLSESGTLPSGVSFDTDTGILSGTPGVGTAGTYPITFTASNGFGSDAIQSFTLTVTSPSGPPSLTSPANTNLTVGAAGSFTVTASGTPAPTLTESGTLPQGVTFHPDTGILSGTPAAGSGGTYLVTFTASNGVAPDATQEFTLTVFEAPAVTSAGGTTFTAGSAGSFTVTASGYPAPTLSESGALPAGVSFDPVSHALSGTPAAGTGGSHPISFTATNGVSPDATQSFTLVVDEAPAVTSDDHATFTVGVAGSFTVTASGTPAPTLTESGALPPGVSFDPDSGALSGTPTAGSDVTYSVTFTAHNSVSPDATQTFTLTVDRAPSITSAATTVFTAGSAGSFTVTAGGHPAPTLTLSGTLPAGVGFDPGTGTLSGTPEPGTGGTYPVTLTAANGVSPDDTQSFTLVVDEAPAVTSDDHATFTVGAAGSFQVTATGHPAPALSESGALPQGVSFDPTTGMLSGTPAAHTGGTYPISVTATNGVGDGATQAYTLTVDEAASITSSDSAGLTVGTAGSFTVTTGGYPVPALSETGSLPGGVTFTPNPGGTATLSGTPTPEAVGSYALTLTATNGIGDPATRTLTLLVRDGTATLVASSPARSISGQTVTITALVGPEATPSASGTASPTDSPPGIPTGTVTFMDGSTSLGTASLVALPAAAATAALTTSALSVGSHDITAVYAGDDSFAPSTSSPLTQVVTTVADVTVTPQSHSLRADGRSSTPVTALVTDAGGQPVPGDIVTFTAAPGAGLTLSSPTATTGGDGVATITVTASTTAQPVVITASEGLGSVSGTSTEKLLGVRFSGESLSTSSMVADGTSTTVASVTVVDGDGHPVAGDTVRFSTRGGPGDPTVPPQPVVTDTSGTAATTVTSSTTPGTQEVDVTDLDPDDPTAATFSTALVFTQVPPPGTSTTSFIHRAYVTMLGHDADTPGYAYWERRLDSGTPRLALGRALASSSEYRADVIGGTRLVTGLYKLYLGRSAPDPGGLAYWLGYMASGHSFEQVRIALLESDEYLAEHHNAPAEIVDALYQDALGRPSDAAGRMYWTGHFDPATIATQMVEGSEGRAHQVTAWYGSILGRSPDATGLGHWTAQLLGGASDEFVIGSLVASTEYLQKQ